ncbi:Archaeal TRASH domain protein [Stieleria magnilauensis]|uniref:Archaeal TRASH domain protein n=1 Tax=Stieleria magnilauensis TaxID=2527963 RepID=A0ABX5XP61_9BACT|nr:Archaeal TRASH domain protein [Planctomycetes bacterium TBK1r]
MKHKILLTAALIAVASVSTSSAQHNHAGHNHAMPGQTATAQMTRPVAGPHGGSLKQAGAVQLETVVSQGGIQMFVFDRSGQPLSVDRGRGAASLRVEGNAKRYRYDLLPDGKGGLTAPVNLSQIAGRQIEIEIQLVGINAAGGQPLTLNEVATVPASELQLAAAAIARQKICPVSGKPLGSMGDPVAVDVNGQRVFVCCGGCVSAVKSDPAKYAAGRPQITVATSTAADAAAIAAQKVCPVMDEPLGGMGTPIKVTIGDKPIYLCCKGCIKKIQAEPAKYLAMVYGDQKGSAGARSDGAPASNPNITVTAATQADAAMIAQQKVCPVMDEPLGSMGDPIKVMVGDKPIFLCCKGCIKRIKADPAKYLAMVYGAGSTGSVPAGTEQVREGIFKVSAEDAPFIAAQKKCPVMDEPLDAMGGPYKVHAAGKAIYICCPGCAKKIAAEPQKWLAVLAQQGVSAPLIR